MNPGELRRYERRRVIHDAFAALGVAFGSIVTPGSLQASIASRTSSTARGRGKLRRHASATRRLGTGGAKGFAAVSLFSAVFDSAAAAGTTVMPTPEATMWRIVSSELPSRLC